MGIAAERGESPAELRRRRRTRQVAVVLFGVLSIIAIRTAGEVYQNGIVLGPSRDRFPIAREQFRLSSGGPRISPTTTEAWSEFDAAIADDVEARLRELLGSSGLVDTYAHHFRVVFDARVVHHVTDAGLVTDLQIRFPVFESRFFQEGEVERIPYPRDSEFGRFHRWIRDLAVVRLLEFIEEPTVVLPLR